MILADKDKKMYADKIINLITEYVSLHNSLSTMEAETLGSAVDVLEIDKTRNDTK